MKTCTKCKITKELSEFSIRSGTKKHNSICRVCLSIWNKAYRVRNKEKLAKQAHDYNMNNKDKRKEYNIKYQNENKEKIAEYKKKNKERDLLKQRAHYHNNKETYLNNNRKWVSKNRAYRNKMMLIYRNKYKALKLSTTDDTISKESLRLLVIEQKGLCYHCGIKLDDTKHLDHYIPLSKGGANSMSNVVWSCKHCNLSKSNTMPTTLMLV